MGCLTLFAVFATMRAGAQNTPYSGNTAPSRRFFHAHIVVFMGWMSQTARLAACLYACFEHPPHPILFKKNEVDSMNSYRSMKMSTSISNVAFHGANLALLNHNGKAYVAIKPICEAVGVDTQAQQRRIARDPVLNSVTAVMAATGSDGKQYEMVCLPLSMLNGWLFGINANRVKNPEIRQKLIAYQFECYDVLNNYWNGKAAIQQKPPVPKNMLVGKINKLQHACEFICGNVGMRVRIPDTLWQSHPLREGDCVYFEYPRGDNPLTSTPIAIHTSKEG